MTSTRAAEARARAKTNGNGSTPDLPRQIDITVDGRTFEWHLPLTLARVADVRAALGISGHRFLAQFRDSDLDLWITAVWLVRRDAGEDVTLQAVFDEYADCDDVTVVVHGERDDLDDDHPEASGGRSSESGPH